MTMIVAGIDPGLSGAIAIVDADGFVGVDDLPAHEVKNGRKVSRSLDLAALRELLVRQPPINHVFLERVAARPGQGVASMFNFGCTFGEIRGTVAALQLPYSLITPQAWQKVARCGPSPDGARKRAGELYPTAAQQLTRKRDGGRADAVLLAWVGLQMLRQT
jgi:crossover junction endodeoxyribonuclease RuvC